MLITECETTTRQWDGCYDPGGADIFEKTEALQAVLERERAEGNYFFRRPLMSASRGRALVQDPQTGETREVIMMGSNSYLGLSADPRVVEASIRAARKYGYGTGAVSLYAGTTDLHIELERRIAAFYRCEDAIVFPTGYAANVGVLSGILRPRDAVVNDMFNHASIYDGCALSGAHTSTYLHGHMRHLERALKRATGPDHGTLVVTDGVFSMEGDMAKLDRIVELARQYGARVMVDEAHALGVVGPTGRGTAEHYGVEGQIDITLGTLSKAPGGIGGYVAGSKALVDYLRYYGRPYFFSTSIPAPVIAGLIEVFNIIEHDAPRREALWRNIRYLVENLRALGFNLGNTESAIIPVIVSDEQKLKAMLRDLFDGGVFVNYVAYPAVPKKWPRLRLNAMSEHTREDLDTALEVFERVGRANGIIE